MSHVYMKDSNSGQIQQNLRRLVSAVFVITTRERGVVRRSVTSVSVCVCVFVSFGI